MATVADPGFPRGVGANSPGGGNIWFCHIFPKKLHKLKEFGPGGARPSRPPLDPPMMDVHVYTWGAMVGGQ